MAIQQFIRHSVLSLGKFYVYKQKMFDEGKPHPNLFLIVLKQISATEKITEHSSKKKIVGGFFY